MMLPYPWNSFGHERWQELAKTYGTPFYLFDANAVSQRVEHVKSTLKGLAKVYYAVKANPNLALLRAMTSCADGVDISSGGELEQALIAGFEPSRMSFAGPAKTDAELEAAIRADVGCISVESIREIRSCARIAEETGYKANILLRVNPQLSIRHFGLKMGGRPVQFGIDEESLTEAEAVVTANSKFLDLKGLHAYVGSQCFEPSGVIEATANALRIASEVSHRMGIKCRKVNLGGGFGVAHAEEPRELDLEGIGKDLVGQFSNFLEVHPGCDLIFELGRYLTAAAGIYVTSVISTKSSRGKTFVACDGGLNHHLAAAGTFGAALRGNFPLRNLSSMLPSTIQCNICGPSCNPTDLLGVEAHIAAPAEGDLLGVLMSGSYGMTASPILFLGRNTPIELVRIGDKIIVGRKSHSITDFN